MRLTETIELSTEAFDTLVKLDGLVDFELDNPDWQDFRPGKRIRVREKLDKSNERKPGVLPRVAEVEVKEVYRGKSFREVVELVTKRFAGSGDAEAWRESLREWYRLYQEVPQGVLGVYAFLAWVDKPAAA